MTEAFLPPEQKLFLRAVEVQPNRGSFNWRLVLALAGNLALWGWGLSFLLQVW